MDKVWDHQKYEKDIYKLWEKSGVFTPKAEKGKKAFTIIMPPPNANDPLHIGHARFVSVEDIIIRFKRMMGLTTLWLPGADHAGIETQYVFEKKLAIKEKSRFDYERDELYKMIWNYVEQNKGVMEKQLRILGASCDWSRFKFTLDPDIIKIVYQTFKKLYDAGLIYRDIQLVNYCTRCGTAYSNLEVNHVERKTPLYYMKYGPFTLATTRPETKFGDTGIAIHPDDKKHKKYLGKTIEVEGLIGKFKIKVVSDKNVDPEFGTGVIKVTPAHDPVDFEIGKKHNLKVKQVIGFNGKLNEKAGKYKGLTVNQARKQVVSDLDKKGLLVKTDNSYTHTVGVCYRCKTVIEPLPLKQWFLKVKPLIQKSLNAIDKGKVKFTTKRFEKISRHWYKNLKDWNLSRQIVWGIQIPAFKCQGCNEWTITDGQKPKECSLCKHTKLIQDQDTFDTWFSSSQWPYATLKTTKPGDFKHFYPTSVMETGYDILPFWVIRMIMMGIYSTGDVPFKNVLIHGLVRDASGQKISKSKGNAIDPIEMIQKYGADALRMGIIWGSLIENDISLSEENIRGQRNFSNKIWNIARFILLKDKKAKILKPKTNNKDDLWIMEELDKTIIGTNKALAKYRLNEAAEIIYEFIWHIFADKYLEKSKKRKTNAQDTLEYILLNCLKLLHPFMPFVTEEIYQRGFANKKGDLLITSPWPSS